MIKKLLVVVAVLVLVSTYAMAEQTGDANFDTGITPIDGFLNDHQHSYDQYDRGIEAGLGLDITVYEFEGGLNEWGFDSVEVQQKYDFNNQDYSLYGVVQVNAWKPIRKLLGI